MRKFGNLITAMVTPFKDDLSVDYDQAAQLAVRLVESGSDGVVVCGTTGESPTLSFEEKVGLYQAVTEAIGGKAAVIAGTGSYDTVSSIKLTQAAEKVGVDGIMLVVPYYNKPPQEGLYQHFKEIAASTELPVMLYNVPGRTSQNLLPDTIARLTELDNVVAVKEASGNMEQVAEIRRKTPASFAIYSGDDSMTLPIMAVGGIGVVSVASHLVGRRMKEMIRSFLDGDVREATRIHLELLPLFKVMFITTNPIPVKTALNLSGFNAGGFRLPLVEPTSEQRDAISDCLRQLGLLD
ncbi:MAG: 4-hydroxy-tetrahydrodipicolinate synthase [Firmicutes bacterium]|nr:4-hydroxy-tetrahydrodipicolinate synthase [Bacillota bacterium]